MRRFNPPNVCADDSPVLKTGAVTRSAYTPETAVSKQRSATESVDGGPRVIVIGCDAEFNGRLRRDLLDSDVPYQFLTIFRVDRAQIEDSEQLKVEQREVVDDFM